MAHHKNVGNVRWRLPQNIEQVVFICKVKFWVIGACAIPGRLKGFGARLSALRWASVDPINVNL
jgi:hypothetical protein